MGKIVQLYWRERKSGQRLILHAVDEGELEVGAVRRTPRGYDALAKTTGYDPGRAQKGFATMEEAKAFVESFRPWEMFYQGDQELEVDSGVRPAPEEGSSSAPSAPSDSTEPAALESRATRRWWEFWKSG